MTVSAGVSDARITGVDLFDGGVSPPPKKLRPPIGADLRASFCRDPPGGMGRRRGVYRVICCSPARPGAGLRGSDNFSEQYGRDDDRADGGALPIRVDVEQVQAVADHHHDQHADERADDLALGGRRTGSRRRSPPRRSCRCEAGRGDRVDRQDARREKHRGDRAQGAGDDINKDAVELDPEAGRARRSALEPIA